MQKKTKPLIFVPTYNERENVEKLCAEILALGLDIALLFVDDSSPDGTGAIIDRLAKQHPNVFADHRPGKLGVGSAHRDGIRWAYAQGYTHLITMDGDFTHPPAYIPEILKMARETDADVVVGSRYLQEKSLAGWNPMRMFLTRTGHFLTKTLLGMPQDATGGFRLYRLDRVPASAFDLVSSTGYSFFFESLYILFLGGFHIAEIPIVLPPRTYGHSKMDFAEVRRSVGLLFSLYATTALSKEKFLIGESLSDDEIDARVQDHQGWDDYWSNHEHAGRIAYDAVAAFYRKFIIKPTLNHFIRTTFAPGAKVLHAGCGSGQVDTDISKYVSITGLDISVNALRLFKKINPKSKVLHGSIFKIPLPSGFMDGVYNLGVMEHFTEPEIDLILRELYRVVKPGGRLVIFWPPEFGASVMFLKGVKLFLAKTLNKPDVKIHPDEITRVQSKKHVVDLFERAGFSVGRYYFGPRDAFTYSVIVAFKPEQGAKISLEPPAMPSSPGSQRLTQ
ncbi:MAG TPA: glycosyltransferase [Polyangia bacterium]